jgi:4-diphosphocytidyl-2-C-methyl-D-erythritol kinase
MTAQSPLPAPSAAVRVRAPAKINLHLAVGDVRADGYHDLVTVFHAVDLADELVITSAERHSVRTAPADGVPIGAKNLAGVAARLLAKRSGGGGPVAIEISKQIPVAGGMAGGSADAAAALVGCAALWGLDMGRAELAQIGAEIGADVPFAMTGGTAVGTGRGDRLSPVLARTPLHWVLALAEKGLSTPAVFAELDRLRADASPPRVGAVHDILAALASGDPAAVGAALGNDLQAAAISLQPELRRTLRAGVAAGALAGVISGSGPTVALLCADTESAGAVAVELAGSGTCRTVRIASGPAPGARLVGTTRGAPHAAPLPGQP